MPEAIAQAINSLQEKQGFVLEEQYYDILTDHYFQ